MNNAIQVQQNNYYNSNDLAVLQMIAKNAKASGLYSGIGEESKIFMILLTAKELGVGPMMALNGGIWNIQGRVEISPRCMNLMIRKAGHSIKIIKLDSKVCILLGTRKDGDSFESTFSISDAEKAGLSKKDVWIKYTEDMLYNRCMSRLGRRLFPDVIGEAYIQGEIEDNNVNIENFESVQKNEMEINVKCSNIIEKKDEINEDKEIEDAILILNELLPLTSTEYQENLPRNLDNIYGTSNLKLIPLKILKGLSDSMNKNIKSQKQAEDV